MDFPAAPFGSPLKLPPISERKASGLVILVFKSFVLTFGFLSFALTLHPVQILAIPLYVIYRPAFQWVQDYCKQAWTIFLILITQVFGPSVLVITSDIGNEEFITYRGDQPYVNLPHKFVTIANHQIYSDWIYLWVVAYLGNRSKDFLIMLKYSLQFFPIMGPAMKFFNFIWMKRNWLADQKPLASYLTRLVKVYKDLPMMLVIFPEGTLVSRETRPLSAKYAKKMEIADLRNVLLPRSTGLRFCLEKLQAGVDYVYDFTIAYEGIPPPTEGKYGQDYFTLRSIYFNGESPPRVHLHVRRFALKDMPLKEGESQAFESWLRERWIEKDELLDHFYANAAFPKSEHGRTYNVPVRTRTYLEWGHLYGFGLPWLAAYMIYKLIH